MVYYTRLPVTLQAMCILICITQCISQRLIRPSVLRVICVCRSVQERDLVYYDVLRLIQRHNTAVYAQWAECAQVCSGVQKCAEVCRGVCVLLRYCCRITTCGLSLPHHRVPRHEGTAMSWTWRELMELRWKWKLQLEWQPLFPVSLALPRYFWASYPSEG